MKTDIILVDALLYRALSDIILRVSDLTLVWESNWLMYQCQLILLPRVWLIRF
jgi:hypothetical protein